jgi:hypothetical protein
MKKLIPEQTSFFKSYIDHVNFAVAARNEKLTDWKTNSEVCLSIGLPTFTTGSQEH